jgi:uncharacterized repeat protein (TIGR01451 family)
VAVDCGLTTTLVEGASMTCTASGIAVTGLYANLGTVTATGVGGVQVSDSDPSHYFGAAPAVEITKFTNGEDADDPTGPLIGAGQPVQWTYLVTNTGNTTLVGWAITDSDTTLVIACPRPILAPSATAICSATRPAVAGQYANTATVNATDLFGTAVSDNDPSHYFGTDPQITLVKRTNGIAVDAPPGPLLPVGSAVTWTYEVTNTGNVDLIGIALQDIPRGVIACPQIALEPTESMTCSTTGTAVEGQYRNGADVEGTDPRGEVVHDSDVSYYFGVTPGIHLEKSVNGDDADVAPGPYVPVGGPVDWLFEVTNTGNAPLTGVTLTDDVLGLVTCPQATLASLQTMECTASGTAVRGQHSNTAGVVGTDPLGAQVSDDDPGHYFGFISGIEVRKYTELQDANLPTGPFLPTGGPVNWAYFVVNTGDLAIREWTITDSDPSVVITCERTDVILPGEMITCNATGTAVAGQYANTVTVVGLDALEQELTDDDPSHYFGYAPGIDIEKSTNGEDADTPTGPSVLVGSPITWTYLVRNTGNVPLTAVTVTDDKLGPISCPANQLAAAATMTCTTTGTAIAGQYANLGTVVGSFVPPEPPPSVWLDGPIRTAADHLPTAVVTDNDPSHYLGVLPPPPQPPPTPSADLGIGKDVDPTNVMPGTVVTFTMLITNNGPDTAINAVVSDTFPADLIGPVVVDDGPYTCSVSGQTMTCTIPEHPAGVTATISVLATVSPFAPVGSPITNVSNVTSPTPDPIPENNTDSAVVTPVGLLPPTGGDPWAGVLAALGALVGGTLLFAVTRARRRIS